MNPKQYADDLYDKSHKVVDLDRESKTGRAFVDVVIYFICHSFCKSCTAYEHESATKFCFRSKSLTKLRIVQQNRHYLAVTQMNQKTVICVAQIQSRQTLLGHNPRFFISS